jgi:hypothetical protein
MKDYKLKQNLYMSVGVMEDYKLRDLRASHTLGILVGRGTGRPKDKDEVNKRKWHSFQSVKNRR